MIVQKSLLGASVSRPKGLLIRHRGTCADHACNAVVDTMPETGARIVPLPLFAGGQRVRIDSLGVNPLDEWMRAQRALDHVGRLSYANANCDVLATYAETGKGWSPQLLGGLALAGVAALIFWPRN